jgi:hypothetical protein
VRRSQGLPAVGSLAVHHTRHRSIAHRSTHADAAASAIVLFIFIFGGDSDEQEEVDADAAAAAKCFYLSSSVASS